MNNISELEPSKSRDLDELFDELADQVAILQNRVQLSELRYKDLNAAYWQTVFFTFIFVILTVATLAIAVSPYILAFQHNVPAAISYVSAILVLFLAYLTHRESGKSASIKALCQETKYALYDGRAVLNAAQQALARIPPRVK